MKYLQFIKRYLVEIVFILLVAFFGYLYFGAYLTLNRIAWYKEMAAQIEIMVFEVTNIGR